MMYKYSISSEDFVERAKKQLKLFDEKGIVESLFYTALNLRFGIEALVFERIQAFFRIKKEPIEITIWHIKHLLEKYSEAEADKPVKITYTINNQKLTFEHRPITKKLIEYYKEPLGKMLHFFFFVDNKYWNYKRLLSEQKTLLSYRNLLEEVIIELEKANQGSLLACAVVDEGKGHRISLSLKM